MGTQIWGHPIRYHPTIFIFCFIRKKLFIYKNLCIDCFNLTDDTTEKDTAQLDFSSKTVIKVFLSDDSIIKHSNPCYLGMAKSNHKHRERFQEYVLQTRPRDSLLDDIFKIE